MTTRPLTLIAGFESTALPLHGVDVADLTGHADRWRTDIDDVLDAGVRTFRYPLRWHRIEQTRVETGHYTRARALRQPHDRPVAGYVGVVETVRTTVRAWPSTGSWRARSRTCTSVVASAATSTSTCTWPSPRR